MVTEEDIKSVLDKQQTEPSVDLQDNVFSVLEITDKEVFHCRFLKYLIKKDWQGFCEKVLKMPELQQCKNPSVECEYHCEHLECMQTELSSSKDGRIDILCKADNAVVAIEVKWYASDQPQQLLRYRKRLQTLFPKKEPILVYLTLNGKGASRCSTVCPAENCGMRNSGCELNESDYARRSFADVISWIESITESYKDEITEQYLKVLKEEYNMEKAVECITETEKDYLAANKIAGAIDKARDTIRRAFMKALDEKIKAEPEIEEVADGLKGKYENRNDYLAYRYNGSKGKKYLIVWATTSLYVQLGDESEYKEGDSWSYVNVEWFFGSGVMRTDTDEGKGNKRKVSAKLTDEGNMIVKWYFASDEEKEKYMNNIISNLRRFLGEDGKMKKD